jgi:two-component system OmpR family response regulator
MKIGKTRILLVDDEKSVSMCMKINLERTGKFEVQTENYAPNALTTARLFRPDIIVMDVRMPEMEGGEVASQMASDPVLKAVPVVFLTAILNRQEAGINGIMSGKRKVLAKPLDLATLIACIEEITQGIAPATMTRS